MCTCNATMLQADFNVYVCATYATRCYYTKCRLEGDLWTKIQPKYATSALPTPIVLSLFTLLSLRFRSSLAPWLRRPAQSWGASSRRTRPSRRISDGWTNTCPCCRTGWTNTQVAAPKHKILGTRTFRSTRKHWQKIGHALCRLLSKLSRLPQNVWHLLIGFN